MKCTWKKHAEKACEKSAQKKHLSYWIFDYLQTEMTRYDEEDEENESPILSSHSLRSKQ